VGEKMGPSRRQPKKRGRGEVGRAQLVCWAAHWAERKGGEGAGWAKGAGEHSLFFYFIFPNPFSN